MTQVHHLSAVVWFLIEPMLICPNFQALVLMILKNNVSSITISSYSWSLHMKPLEFLSVKAYTFKWHSWGKCRHSPCRHVGMIVSTMPLPHFIRPPVIQMASLTMKNSFKSSFGLMRMTMWWNICLWIASNLLPQFPFFLRFFKT